MKTLFLLSLACLVAAACASVHPPEAPKIRLAEGTAVQIDGHLTQQEWKDADRIILAGGAQLLSKRIGDKWLLGVRSPPATRRYVDVFVRDSAGRLLNLHASLQQGDRVLIAGWTDDHPPFRWGASTYWRTSIANRSAVEAEAGAQTPGIEGYEMELALAYLGRCPFKVRVEIRDFFGKEPDWTLPASSTRADPAGWAPLITPCGGMVD